MLAVQRGSFIRQRFPLMNTVAVHLESTSSSLVCHTKKEINVAGHLDQIDITISPANAD